MNRLILSLALSAILAGQSAFENLAAQAAAAREAERLDDALALYRKGVALKPSWAEGWWYAGTLLYDKTQYREAAQAFEKAAALSPKDGTPLVMLGLCERELGEDERALADIDKGNRLGLAEDPHLRQVVLFTEAKLLQEKGSFENAQRRLHSLCLQGLESDEVMETLGMAALRQASRKVPSPGTPDGEVVRRVGRAQCLAAQKKYEEARRNYRAIAAEYPDYPNIHYACGRFLLEAGDSAAGLDELKREIARDPAHAMARLQIAAAQYKVDSAAGLPYAEEAVKLDPKIPIGHYLLGLLLLDTNNWARAIPELELAQKAFPREAKVYLVLGGAYSRAGREQDAARARMEFQRLNQDQQGSSLPDPR